MNKKNEKLQALKLFINENKLQKRQVSHQIKILNFISVADCFVMKKFFNSCDDVDQFVIPKDDCGKENDEYKIITARANRMKNIKKFYINYKTANLIYPFDIFGTKHFREFFFAQKQSTRDKFYQQIRNINSFLYDDNSFKNDLNNIIEYRGILNHNKENKDKDCQNFFIAIQKFIPSTKFINQLKQLVFNKKPPHKNLTNIQNYTKIFPDDLLNKNKFLTNPRLHTMRERLSFIGFDNISKIKEWLLNLKNFSEDTYFINSAHHPQNNDLKKFVKHIKFEEIEIIFFWVIELNFIFKKYFVRIFEIFDKIIEPSDLKEFKEIKDLRNKIAHSHLIIGETIAEDSQEKLKFEISYYKDILTKMLSYFDQVFFIVDNDRCQSLSKILSKLDQLDENHKTSNKNQLLAKILREKTDFLKALKGLTRRFDNYHQLNSDKTEISRVDKEKINLLKEKSKLSNNKKSFYDEVIKFHFYALLKSQFYKIICEVKNTNYQSNDCIKLK